MSNLPNDQRCKCVSCGECRGTGNVWVSLSGDYLGNSHCDDMDDLERCEECRGSGISELCDLCECLEDESYG